jgi:PGF-CTERM protein
MLDIVDHRLLNSTFTDRIPIIDGEISVNEWDRAEGTFALKSAIPPSWEESGGHITGPGITNDSDASHLFWSMYDMEYVYFLFNCSDDSIWVDNYPDDFWRDDSIEIAIDGAFDRDVDQRTDEGFEDGDTFNVPADGQPGITYSYSAGSQHARNWGRNSDWFSAVTSYSDDNVSYYIIEVAIRLSVISNPAPASFVGLNTGQNDDDDGNLSKEGVIRWQGLDGYEVWKNETLWGNLYFRTEVRADAGTSQVLNQSQVASFDGSKSWSNHPDFSTNGVYTWTFMYDGEEVSISGEKPTFKFDIPGVYVVNLNVTDGTEEFDTDSVIVSVRDTEAPVADAGGNVTIDQGTTFTLDASGSTDNHPDFPACATFEWDFIDDGVIRRTGLKVEYTFERPGEYVIRLKVTDPSGMNFDLDTMTVTVLDVEPPVADAGEDITVDDGQYVNLDGSNSTDNFGIMRYVWEFRLGQNLVNITGQKPAYRFPAPGVYNVTLTVFDYDGQTSSDSIIVSVIDVTPPVADAGDVREINEDILVTLDGVLSFDNVAIVSYEWTISLEGVVLTVPALEGMKPKYNFSQPGLYEITLLVTDAMGLTSEDTIQYSVLDITKPHSNAGLDKDVNEDETVTFTGAASTDNVEIVEYEWIIESDNAPRVRRVGQDLEYVFAEPGEYTLTLTVTDKEGLWDSDALTVIVADITDPTAVAPSSVEIKVGQTVVFDGRASTDNVGIVRYSWTYEIAGVPLEYEGANITQPFEAKGNYTIILKVEDAAGNTDTTTFNVLVKKPKQKDDSPGFGALVAVATIGGTGVALRRRRDR